MRRRIAIAAVGLLLGLSACAGLRNATEADLPRAHAVFPGATVGSLNEGRSLYAAHCSGCHTLHLPETRTAPEWNDMMDEMVDEAHLTVDERKLVEQYLLTFAKPLPGSGSSLAKSRPE